MGKKLFLLMIGLTVARGVAIAVEPLDPRGACGGSAPRGPIRQAAALENAALRVEVGAQGELAVLDKRNGRTWKQVPVGGGGVQLDRAPLQRRSEVRYTLGFDGISRTGGRKAAPFEVSVRLGGVDEVVAEFTPAKAAVTGEWREVRYPFAFLPPEGEQPNLLFPNGEGLLVPANTNYPGYLKLNPGQLHGGVRSYLNCVGTVELASGAGLLAIPLPFESADVHWPVLGGGTPGAVGVQHAWRANRYKLDRPFSLRWQFTAEGGYVAMAKGYRRWCGGQGWRKTLLDKRGENPDVDKLIGAPIYWAYDTIQGLSRLVDDLKSAGVDRCVLGLDPRLYDCLLEPTATELAERRAVVEKARAAGFLVHHYDNYRDSFERNEKLAVWHQINWDAYPHDIVVREDGKLLSPGFPEGPNGVITPRAFLKYAKRHLPRDLERYPWNARFIDCIGSCAFDEGVDWHPDRPEATYFYTREQREKLMRYSNRLGQLTGTECGLDYLIPYVHWFDGAMQLVMLLDMPPGTFGLQDVAADGSQKGQIMVREPDGNPCAISESVNYRIPFWSLVHHDDAVITWRWEYGMTNPAAWWRRKVLLNMLSGTPPLYRDVPFRKFQAAIGETHRLVSPWCRRVGYDEMVSHRFVTADRLVQETRFSSGAGIRVNFGRTPFKGAGAVEIPAEGYVIFAWQAGQEGSETFEPPVAVRINPTVK